MTKQRSLMGRRYIEVFEASATDIRHLQEFIASTQAPARASAYGSDYGSHSGYVAAPASYSSLSNPYSGHRDSRVGYSGGYGQGQYGAPSASGRDYGSYQQPYARETTSTVIVRGLGYGVTQRDIAGLFRDYRVTPEDVSLYMGPDGRTPQQVRNHCDPLSWVFSQQLVLGLCPPRGCYVLRECFDP
jgi:hypothetical protein